MWRREVNGRTLTFHLAGINNQNFLMRDEETGTYWQQISGRAISGLLAGHQLDLVASDELTFATWRSEYPSGTVLSAVSKFESQYEAKEWEKEYAKLPVVTRRQPGEPLEPRRLVLGIQASGASRAFPVDRLLARKLVQDAVGAEPVLIVVAADNASIRVFRRRLPGQAAPPDFYRKSNALLLDAATGSEWNFQGCAVAGPAKGVCLDRVNAVKDYWFDWRLYNPATTVYRQ